MGSSYLVAHKVLSVSFVKSYIKITLPIFLVLFILISGRMVFVGNDVRRFQMFLYKICRRDKSIPGVRVNGVFDELTEESVKKLQGDYGFAVNGVVGPLLWKKVVELSKD